jgi:molybdate transport system ATP-binding protein
MSTRLNRPFGTLSTGEQRLTLLIRALIKNPPVLLLDEPFQALDTSTVYLARQLLDALPDKSLLFVTHDRRELPGSVDRTFDLGSVNPG